MVVVEAFGFAMLEETDKEGGVVDQTWEEGFEESWRTVRRAGGGTGDSKTGQKETKRTKNEKEEVRRVENERQKSFETRRTSFRSG